MRTSIVTPHQNALLVAHSDALFAECEWAVAFHLCLRPVQCICTGETRLLGFEKLLHLRLHLLIHLNQRWPELVEG